MRIKKGSLVEAWTEDAAPPMGAWRAGKVLWGNGHSYILGWSDGAADSGRISRKCVRPRPPPVALPEDLAAGDMVEVDDNFLWKCAEVVGAGADGRRFDVKIVGSTTVLTAERRKLRVRQVLREDDVWVVLHKDSQIPCAKPLPSRAIPGKHGKGIGNGNGIGKLATPPSKCGKPTKRSHCMVDADIVRDVERFQGSNNKRLCVDQEEAPRCDDNLEVIYVNPDVRLHKQPEMSSEECDVAGTGSNSGDDTSNSVSSSVGSSSDSDSGSGGRNTVSGTSKPCADQNAIQVASYEKEDRDHSDDRTESRVSVRKQHPAIEKAAALEEEDDEDDHEGEQEGEENLVHRLELDAYRALMKAFHASGPLTWTKEELLSKLRLHLHISSDEHLQAIWDLNGKRKSYGQ